MNEIESLFQNKTFLEVIMEAFLCGLFVIDAEGHFRAFNKTVRRLFGVNHERVAGKGVGNALNCLHAFQKPDGCGSVETCEFCEARNLAQNVISSNRKQKKQNLWNHRKCDKELRRDNVVELGKCPAAIDTSFDGINSGTNAGKACWAETGPCHGEDVYRLRNTDRHDLYRTDLALRLAPEF
jgi:hypothetical protein